MTDRIDSVGELRKRVVAWRREGHRVGFVPTMGNLHEGHLALVRRARELADRVVASIFVNPTQFGPGEDYESYPRTVDEDLRLLADNGCDLAFVPGVATMYPFRPENAVRMNVPGITEILEGERRPGHFDGVATVVTRLFQMVQPDLAVFGRKDYQQLEVIRRMTEDLSMPVEIVGADTVREHDGLALSSRNQYLTAEERERAPLLYRVLGNVAQALESGGRDVAALERRAMDELAEAGFEPEYVAVRQPDLAPPRADGEAFVVLGAARLGRARLIDNLRAGPGSPD